MQTRCHIIVLALPHAMLKIYSEHKPFKYVTKITVFTSRDLRHSLLIDLFCLTRHVSRVSSRL